MKSIAIAGNMLVDKINEIESYPESGQLVKINNVTLSCGGCVPNVGIDIKKLLPEIKVYAVGKTGKDSDGEYIKSTLSKNGLNTDNIVFSDIATSFTQVMSIKGGERTFFTYPGANDQFCSDDIDFETFRPDYFHLGYFLLLKKIDNGDGEKILKKATEKGIKTSIDLVSDKNGDYKKILPCLKYTDNLIINEIEGGNLAETEPTRENLFAICKKLKSYGVRERVIIHSPEISVCYGDRYTELPSFDLPKGYIKGSTGAGDAFCAGSLAGIMKGLSEKEILEYGSCSAVMALSEKDAVSGMKTLEETIKYCKRFQRKKL